MGYYFLCGFFLGFGSEDLGTERTVLIAAFNRSNGVCGVGNGQHNITSLLGGLQ